MKEKWLNKIDFILSYSIWLNAGMTQGDIEQQNDGRDIIF